MLFSCRRKRKIADDEIVYIQIGDSITFGAKNNGGNTPGDFAVRALASPVTFIKMGWAGESARQFNQYRQKQLQDTLNSIPAGHRIILGIAYGANDLPQMCPKQVLENILRITYWAHDTMHIAKILIIPVMNRKDKWGLTYEQDGTKCYCFNEARLWLNAQLHIKTRALNGIQVANESDSPRMYAASYPDDTTLCADKVHPFDPGAKELGEGTIAHGLARFSRIVLK